MSKAKMQAARELIQQKKYDEARVLLNTIDNPTAWDWLAKLDKIAPEKPVKGYTPAPPPPHVEMPPAPPASMEQAIARTKSYTWAVVVVILLYFCAFIPGVIANVLLHEDGKRMEKIAGMPLPGVSTLGSLRQFMFLIFIVLLVVLVAVFLMPMLLRM